MTTKINVFLTGVTGYLGGTVLSRFLQHPEAASFEITALVRSVEKAESLRSLGVKPVLGSYHSENLDVLTATASNADVVITMVDCENVAAAEAILKGLSIKHQASGKVPIFIHTSGTAIIIDDARGLHGDHRTYSDLESDLLNAIPATVFHRAVDITLVEADKAGYVRSYLITPGTLFGYPSGPVADLGLQNMHSMQIPWFIKPSIVRKKGAYFGKGLNKWAAVDVNDTADLFLILLTTVLKSPDITGHGIDGYYFAENLHYSALEVAQAIAEGLVEQGISSTPEISPFTLEESEKYFGAAAWPFLATNSYAKGERSRALGWTPKHGMDDLIVNIKSEVAFYSKEEK